MLNKIESILKKYKNDYVSRLLAPTQEADELAQVFFNDVAEILDVLSSSKNGKRNPTGFSINDAPILGLLVRSSKLLKLVLWIYSEESAEYTIIAERSLLETSITATYLLNAEESSMDDYRRCSYCDRVKLLEQAASGVSYYNSKAGRRILRSIKKKLASEGLNENSFAKQIANRWRLEGKSFREIFESVMGENMYSVFYGISSDSVHGSWLDTRHYSLRGDSTNGFHPLYEPVCEEIGNLPIMIVIVLLPYRGWLKRVSLEDTYINEVLDFIELLNWKLFEKYGNFEVNQ